MYKVVSGLTSAFCVDVVLMYCIIKHNKHLFSIIILSCGVSEVKIMVVWSVEMKYSKKERG